MENNKVVKHLRSGLLALFVVLITLSAYLHQVNGGDKSPSIHALCPFGGLESLYTFFAAGTYISKIFAGTMILFVITIVLAVIFRRSFCGLICPFGAIQEFFGKAGQVLFRRKFIMPAIIDRPLRYLKYVILVITIFYAWKTAGLWMSPYDPWAAYAHLPEGLASVWESTAVGLILLVVTIIGSMIYDRFFCKYLCPVGALYAIVGKISPYKIKRNENTCIECGICSKSCPVNIDVQHSKEVKSAECIDCLICVVNCPKTGALEVKEGTKTIKPIVSLVLVMVLFFGAIFISQAAGIYNVVPKELKAGESLKIEEVKGYMTIKDAAEATKLDLKELYTKFQIPERVPEETKMKEIKNIAPEYDFEKVKEALMTEAENAPSEPAKINAEGVVGSMTITEAAKAVNLDIKEFYKLFKIPDNVPAETIMKEIGNIVPDYDFHSIKSSLE